ncbi:ABC transporter permease [Nocardioides sp.]|uniref:ABC transporter permease n=1 Tax=Nocardioides sp. TaxID=35761 RepID=UPI000C9103F1|nr:ABC transporter permease [Nocardioides sp.]MAS56585.1 peptide ABC transporter permease [Pimelobacter sp.]MDE0775157.1 ABC transporter permease [Nocardioides sp.]
MASSSGSLPRYIALRVLLIIPLVWVLLTVVFLLLRVAPGDPVSATVGDRLSEDALDERRAAAGLDRPLVVQYLDYLGNVARFDFGNTFRTDTPILSIVRDQGGATLTLTVGAFLIALLIGIPLGRLAGRFRDTPGDVAIRVYGVVSYAAPLFWVGILLVVLVNAVAPSFPTNDIASPFTKLDSEAYTKTHILVVDTLLAGDTSAFLDVLQHHLLPCLTLGFLLSGVIVRLVRINVIQALQGDYVEAARARGIGEGRVVRKHAFRNALVPVITVVGLQVALTLSGAVLTEKTFNWPGVGSALVRYIGERDYIAVQGLVTFFAVVVVFTSLIVDVINALVDPRVRY